jgi:hypothetical protein
MSEVLTELIYAREVPFFHLPRHLLSIMVIIIFDVWVLSCSEYAV